MPPDRVIVRTRRHFQASATVAAVFSGGKGRRVAIAFAVVVVAAGLSVPAASASLLGGVMPSCGPMSHPFAQFGDDHGYCEFSNLGFESGASGWTLHGDATVVSGNEPWNVSGPGTHSLELGPGASALSAPLPVNLLDPWIRFFAKSDGADGSLRVQVVFSGLLGNLTGILNYGSLSAGDYSSWQPTQRISSLLALPLLTRTTQVLVTNTSSSGSWQLDDLYLDPCISRVA